MLLHLQVEPSDGTAMSTDFILRAFGWMEVLAAAADAEEDLLKPVYQYKFGYFAKEDGKDKFTLLRSYTEEAEATRIKLPPGSFILKSLVKL